MSTPNNRGSKKRGKNNQGDNNGPKLNTILPIAVLAILFVLLFNFLYSSYAASMTEEIKYNEFKQMLEDGEVDEVEIQSDRILILTKEQAKEAEGSQVIYYTGLLTDEELLPLLDAGSATIGRS
jgi:cell division protease FtsH